MRVQQQGAGGAVEAAIDADFDVRAVEHQRGIRLTMPMRPAGFHRGRAESSKQACASMPR
jgi:hypothetical protein